MGTQDVSKISDRKMDVCPECSSPNVRGVTGKDEDPEVMECLEPACGCRWGYDGRGLWTADLMFPLEAG